MYLILNSLGVFLESRMTDFIAGIAGGNKMARDIRLARADLKPRSF
jgi:hypothetical protein